MQNSLNIIAFASGAGLSLQSLIDSPYAEVCLLVCDEECKAMEVARAHEIPILYRSFQEYLKSESGWTTRKSRKQYDTMLATEIRAMAHQNQYSIDLLFLLDYQGVVSRALLEAFPDLILSLHAGDLADRDGDGHRLWTGGKPVEAAIATGRDRTRSSV